QAGGLVSDFGGVRFKDGASGADRQQSADPIAVRVVEPFPTIIKDVNQTSVQAGTQLTYTLKVCNDEGNNSSFSTSAFDWNISDHIPDDILLSSGPTVDLNGTIAIVDTSASNGQDINATIDRLHRGECISIAYEATVQQSAQFAQTMTNTANFTTTSLPGSYGTYGNPDNNATWEPGQTNGERTGTGGVNDLFKHDDATVIMNRSTLNKLLISTKLRYAIGEKAHYRIRVDMLPGEAKNFIINDTLPVGLELNTSTIFFGVVGGITQEHTPPNITQNGNVVSFDYGDINATTAAQFVIDYNATVTNVLSNQDGVQLLNDANATFDDPNNAGQTITVEPADLVTVIVGEANIEIQKSITAGAVEAQAGKTVSWEVVISNDPANNAHKTAYAVNWKDVLPSHLANIQNSILVQTGVDVNLTGQTVRLDTSHLVENNTTLSLPAFDLPVGSTVTVTFDSIVQNDAVAGETQTNNTDVSYLSILGADGSFLGGRNSLDCGDDDDSSTNNNYCESATSDLIIDAGISLDKQLQGTQVNYTIGEQVTYEMRVSLIEGITKKVVLNDTLPAGLRYVSHAHQNAAPAMIYNFASANVNSGSDTNVIIDFGDVNNSADGNTTNDYIDVELTVLVENVVGNQNGYKPENGDIAGTLVTVTSDANTSAVTVPVQITITEPDLNVTKRVTPDTQATGDVVTYFIHLAHSSASTSDAYDINFTDTLPVDLTYIPGSVTGAPNFAQNGQVLTFSYAHLAQGDTRDISYKARINDNASISAPLVNSLDTVYSGNADANGSSDGYRNGSDGVGGALNDYALHTEASVQPNHDVLTPVKDQDIKVDTNNDGLINAGDILEYNLTVSNGLAYNVGEVNVTDVLDPNVTLLLDSIMIDGTAYGEDSNTSWTMSGYWYTYANSDVDITYNSDTNYLEVYWQNVLNTGDTLDITYDVVINDGTDTIITFDNGSTINLGAGTTVQPGTVIDNIFTVDSNRTIPVDSNEVNVTTDQRGIVIEPIKRLTATDQSFTDPGDVDIMNTPPVAVGEIIDVQISFEFSGGTTRTVVLRDNFNNQNFVYVANSTRLIRSSDHIEVSDVDLNSSFVVDDNISVDDSKIIHDANGFSLDVRDVFNNNYNVMNVTESLTMTFRLRVDNNVTVQAGVQLDDNASVSFNEYNAITSSSNPLELHSRPVGVVVVEPDIEITKTVNPAAAKAGDFVTYTLKICNDESNTSTYATTGFDWEIKDEIPIELALIVMPVADTNGTSATVDVSQSGGQNIIVTIDKLNKEECVSVQYVVEVTGAAEFNQTIINEANVTATSLFGVIPGQRTGTNLPPLNDLNATSFATLQVDVPNVTKNVLSPKSYYPIGDTVQYRISLSFTGSAEELKVVDILPLGLTYVSNSAELNTDGSVVIGTDINVSHNPPLESVGSKPTEIIFDIGDFNTSKAGTLYLDFNATVDDIATNVNDTNLTNVMEMVYLNPNTQQPVFVGAVSSPIRVGEPDLHVSKTITTDLSVPKSAGDVISYEIKITNVGTTTAYFVEWEDKVPVHTGEIHNPYQQVHAGTAYETNTTTALTDTSFVISMVDELDDHIALAPFDLSPGATLVITFDTIIQPNVIPAETLVNITGATTQSTVGGGRKHTGINGDKYTSVAEVSFTINQLPEAIDDCSPPLLVTHYGENPGDLWSNDKLGDGTREEHTWRVVTQPLHGSVVVHKDGTYVYSPDPDYNNGSDEFRYELEDSNGDKSQANVCIDVYCASSQTSDGGDALGNAGMLLMLLFTAMTGLYFIRKEER
ncbi:MAG: hypothetical protein DRQ78_06205, partial [Epsilonproteobacteria bacterium]